MPGYPRRTLILYCALTSLITIAIGWIAGETLYPRVRPQIRRWIAPAAEVPRGQSAEFNTPWVQDAARKKWQSIVDSQAEVFGANTLRDFEAAWYKLEIWRQMFFLGLRIQKYPNDLWIMQQIISEVRPDFIIETGTFNGGSALYWAHILDGLDLQGSRVITIDIVDNTRAASERRLWKEYVEFIHSDSTDAAMVGRLSQRVQGKKVLVTVDSLHRGEHVLRELNLYSPLVSPGSYMVVEDTQIDGLPVDPNYGSGPMDAVIRFLAAGGDKLFEQDNAREALIPTQNRGGWLRRR